VKRYYVGENHVGDVPLLTKIAAGLTTGALAITIASPTDLVKVRMQSEGKLPAGVPKKYPSAMAAYSIIAKYEPHNVPVMKRRRLFIYSQSVV
jgi:solute carrier family 25 (mitochondrial uncoupling protein), member 8/9